MEMAICDLGNQVWGLSLDDELVLPLGPKAA